MHQGVKDLEVPADHISKVGQVDSSQIEITVDDIRLELHVGELKAIAADDYIRTLERVCSVWRPSKTNRVCAITASMQA